MKNNDFSYFVVTQKILFVWPGHFLILRLLLFITHSDFLKIRRFISIYIFVPRNLTLFNGQCYVSFDL